MAKSSTPGNVEISVPDISGFFPAIELWAYEDPNTLADLRTALIADLAPGTPYQHTLADNLVELEWDKLRHRRMRDALLRAAVRDSAVDLLTENWSILGPPLDAPVRKTGADLVGTDSKRRQAAEEKVRKAGASLSELIAKAYRIHVEDMDHHERQIAETENRRRRLRQDYDLLKSRQAAPIEDADFVQTS